MLAVGDSGGTLHILEVPWSLSHPSTSEVSSCPYLLPSQTHTHTLVFLCSGSLMESQASLAFILSLLEIEISCDWTC